MTDASGKILSAFRLCHGSMQRLIFGWQTAPFLAKWDGNLGQAMLHSGFVISPASSVPHSRRERMHPLSDVGAHSDQSQATTCIDDDANDAAARILLRLYPSTALVAVRGLPQRATSLVPCTRATMISCIRQRNLLHCQRYCRRSLSQISNKRCPRRHHPAT